MYTIFVCLLVFRFRLRVNYLYFVEPRHVIAFVGIMWTEGVIGTNLGRHIIGSEGALNWLYANVFSTKTIPQGAATTLYACLAPELAEAQHRGCYLCDCSLYAPTG
jgi:hypothetical protein